MCMEVGGGSRAGVCVCTSVCVAMDMRISLTFFRLRLPSCRSCSRRHLRRRSERGGNVRRAGCVWGDGGGARLSCTGRQAGRRREKVRKGKEDDDEDQQIRDQREKERESKTKSRRNGYLADITGARAGRDQQCVKCEYMP